MSSPSSSGSGKRKRNSTLPTGMKKSSAAELQQPSSRDASGEDAEDSTAQNSASGKHKKSAPSSDSNNPPSKRPRTRSAATKDGASSNDMPIPSIQQQDPGEPSDTTEASTEIASRSKRKGRGSLGNGEEDDQLEDTKAMPPPVKGGLQDPVGYHTNPPPKGRAVRIYADGVFDLFHLGYVSPVPLGYSSTTN